MLSMSAEPAFCRLESAPCDTSDGAAAPWSSGGCARCNGSAALAVRLCAGNCGNAFQHGSNGLLHIRVNVQVTHAFRQGSVLL